MLDAKGEVAYEMHLECVNHLPFAEYVTGGGVTGPNSVRHRVKHTKTGDQFTLTPFGLNLFAYHGMAPANASTLVPNFFRFSVKPAGADRPVVTSFV